MRHLRAFIAVLAGGVIALGAGAPAGAGQLAHGSYHDSGEELIEDFCGIDGFDVVHSFDFSGSFNGTAQRDGLAHFRDSVRDTHNFLNPETGKSFSWIHLGHGHDLSVTDNGDGTLTVIFQNSGLDSWYDGDGNEVLSVAGVTRDELLIDNSGFVEYIGRVKTWPNNPLEGHDFCEDFFLFTA